MTLDYRGSVNDRYSLINLTGEGESSDAFYAGAFSFGSFILMPDPDGGVGSLGNTTVVMEVSVDGDNWANPEYQFGPNHYLSSGRPALVNVDLRGIYAVRFTVSKADGSADPKAQIRVFMQHMG